MVANKTTAELRRFVESYGYKCAGVERFKREAPPELVARYERDGYVGPGFVVWDPQDDADGWLLGGENELEALIETARMIEANN